MTIHELKQAREEKISALIAEVGMFFAFTNEQFEKSKTPLEEGDKYCQVYGGAYMPSRNAKRWHTGGKEIGEWFDLAIVGYGLRRAYIEYELVNHEAGYTYEIDQTLEALGEGYTAEEVQAVFNQWIQLQDA